MGMPYCHFVVCVNVIWSYIVFCRTYTFEIIAPNTAKYRYHCQRRALVLNFRHTKGPSRQPQAHDGLTRLLQRERAKIHQTNGNLNWRWWRSALCAIPLHKNCPKTNWLGSYIYLYFVYAEYYPVLSRLFRLWSWTWISDRSHYKVYQYWIWFFTFIF